MGTLPFWFCFFISLTMSSGVKVMPENILSRYPGQNDYISPTTYLEAVAGHSAHLPCNITSPLKGDPPMLVLWYKNGVIKPIYSYDMRSGLPTHWKNEKHMGSRGSFNANKGELVIQRVTKEDQNDYKCRVDFKVNPTLSFAVNLTVIIPPKRLWIVTEAGRDAGTKVGPYIIGNRVLLTCKVSGGRPPPKVVWREGHSLLDDVIERTRPQTVANTLLIERLTRADLNRVITCVANNTHLMAPLQQTVTIDMKFPPLDVQLLTKDEPLSAGKMYKIECEAIGSRPIAHMEFTLDGHALLTHSVRSSEDGNHTLATLLWTPRINDSDKELACKASSPSVEKIVSDSFTILVYYKPQVHLQPGHSLDLSNIEEGDDVYFECLITADPPVYKVEWLLNNEVLQHNVSVGVIISNQSLVLQRVEKNASGKYACRATNTEGGTTSDKVILRVKYAPVCKSQQVLFHGAARLEQVHIPCHLDAHPMPSSYSWTFNNSGESVKIPEDHVKVDGFKSTVSYTPMTELDYGTLLCWGTNVVGKQRNPCVFHVFPAGRPDPVHNCSQFNLSDSAVNIRCSPGFDGGLPQTFVLELYDNHSSRLVANVTSDGPILSVSNLEAATSFAAVIYSTNEKGSGELFRLQTYTLKDNAEKRTAAIKPAPSSNGKSGETVSPLMVGIMGIIGGLILVIVIIAIAIKLRLKRRHRYAEEPHVTTSSMETVNISTSLAPIIRKEPIHHSYEAEDINPDVLPHADPIWRNAQVHTISSSSMVGSFATLPRRVSGNGSNNGQGFGQVVPYSDTGLTRAPSLQSTCTSHCMGEADAVMYTPMDTRRLSQPLVIPPPPPQFASSCRGEWRKSCSSNGGRWLDDLEGSFHCQKRFSPDDDDMKKSLLQGQHESSV